MQAHLQGSSAQTNGDAGSSTGSDTGSDSNSGDTASGALDLLMAAQNAYQSVSSTSLIDQFTSILDAAA